jgi:Uma2 family endonuclease
MAANDIRAGSRPRLGPVDAGRRVSAEEFAHADHDDPWCYERANGRLVVLPPQDREHAETTAHWIKSLGAYRSGPGDRAPSVVPDARVRVDEATDRVADVGVYVEAPPGSADGPDRVPDLLFEVVGPGRSAHDRDYLEKRSEYERIGVKEYVIIDRFARRVTVLTPAPADIASGC